jgi:hypothetical protein
VIWTRSEYRSFGRALAQVCEGFLSMLLIKLPGHVRAPAGWEWRIFKKLPMALVGGLALIGLITLAFHSFPPTGSADEIAKHLAGVDILAIALAILHVTLAGTVAIGCIIVLLMKGPAYVADGFEVSDADAPSEAASWRE